MAEGKALREGRAVPPAAAAGAGARALLPAGAGGGFVLHLALGLWGLSSWILFNGLWGQLPLFVRTLPEGNRVGVMILTAEQLAYVFPLFFMLKKRCFPNHSRAAQEVDIWLLLLSGFGVSLLLGRYWSYQAPLGGVQHSVGLMALAFLAGAVCSSTGVVYTPYISNCPRTYTSAHTAGAGLSGLAVALLSLLADTGAARPRLSIEAYYSVLSAAFLCSMASFAYVSRAIRAEAGGYMPLQQGQQGKGAHDKAEAGYGSLASTNTSTTSTAQPPQRRQQRRQSPPRASVVPGADDDDGGEEEEEVDGDLDLEMEGPSSARRVRVISPAAALTPVPKAAASTDAAAAPSPVWQHWPVFTLQFGLSALAYGIVPSVLPLACAGFPDPTRVLFLATVGYMLADPVGKLATSFLATKRVFLCGALTVAVASLLLLCAARSAHPPLAALPYGGLLPVAANTLFSFLFSYTSISVFFRRRAEEEEEEAKAEAAGAKRRPPSSSEDSYNWFRWTAFIIQSGAVTGTLLMAALAAMGVL